MTISVETEARAGWNVVRVSGDIDLGTAPELRERLAIVLDGGAERLILDLAQVEFIDSTALSVMVGAHKRLARRGSVLHLVSAGSQVVRVLDVTGLSRVFAMHGSLDEAVEGAVQ